MFNGGVFLILFCLIYCEIFSLSVFKSYLTCFGNISSCMNKVFLIVIIIGWCVKNFSVNGVFGVSVC